MTWQFFDPATLELAGRSYTGPAAALAANTPAGLVPVLVPELLDPRRHVVRWVTDDHGEQLAVVDARTPAQPAETEWMGWAWDDAAEQWREVPKLKLLQANARRALLGLLTELDGKLTRPLGEILQAQVLGQAVPEAAALRLQAVNADKDAVRARIAAINQAASVAALGELLAAPLSLTTIQP
jgi:hypothetical protein